MNDATGAAPECPHDPQTHAGKPIGMYHCPECGCMVLAGLPHPVCDIDFCEYGVVIEYNVCRHCGDHTDDDDPDMTLCVMCAKAGRT